VGKTHASLQSANVFPGRVSSTQHFTLRFVSRLGVSIDSLIKDEDRTEDDKCGIVVAGQCPRLQETVGDLAKRVLADPYFYDGDVNWAERNWKWRRHYLGEKKIEDIEKEYRAPAKRIALCNEIKCFPEMLNDYFDQGAASVEDELWKREIIALNGKEDIERIDKRWVHLDSWGRLLDESLTPNETRNGNIIFILGPSGSGKTFLAATQASTYKVEQKRRTTIYMNLVDSGVSFTEDEGANMLVDWIKKTLKTEVKSFDADLGKALDMHVTFVLDEAGASSLGGYFEEKESVKRLYSALEKFAASIRLIVCGTGLVGENVCSHSDVFKIRMNEWDQTDVKLAAHKFQWNQPAFPEKARVIGDVVASIFEYPVLGSLTTNARSAWYLLEEVNERFRVQNSVQSTWKDFLHENCGHVVSCVVDKYVAMNGLQGLSAVARRRVAALVFHIVEESRANAVVMAERSVATKWYAPTFNGPSASYKDYASGLLYFNVNYMGMGAKLWEGETTAVSLSPALAIVAFSLLVGSASLLATRPTQKLVAGLHIYRQKVLTCFQTFQHESDSLERHQRSDESWVSLDKRLSNLQLIQVKQSVPEPRTGPPLYVPVFMQGETVWMNTSVAPFADVVAPYVLAHAEQSEDGIVTVFLAQELLKCGLLKPECLTTEGDVAKQSGERGWMITRGLCAVWKNDAFSENKLVSEMTSRPLPDGEKRADKKRRSLANAHPENVLVTTQTIDHDMHFAISQAVLDDLAAPESLEKEITFLVTYNAADVNLQLNFQKNARRENPIRGEENSRTAAALSAAEIAVSGDGKAEVYDNYRPETMTIFENDLDDGVFNPEPDDERFGKWQDLLLKLRPNVIIKFLPT
jgi:hypothetical protein